MIKSISTKITDFFIGREAINEEDRDIYLYGSEILISEILCTMITLGIGLFLGCFIKTIIYLIIYTMIRIYAGGYHAMSHKMCITIFNVLYVFFLAIVELTFYLKISGILCFSTIISVLIIYRLAPVQDPRKILDEFELEKYRNKARRRTIFSGICVILTYFFIPFAKDEMGYGMIAICEVALLVVIGYIKNKFTLFVAKKKIVIRGEL